MVHIRIILFGQIKAPTKAFIYFLFRSRNDRTAKKLVYDINHRANYRPIHE